ncbi:MAG: dethiobiotin synthase [Candidatus Eremiobacteraeota bacterium]|nr:dethiobiotin synthase [Candidatus Eremiobacteraeota bacterium]
MHRYFVTGTDTDVGKTRVTAALAGALRERALQPTIAKLVQTGLNDAQEGDAARAGRLAGVPHVELARFLRAGDPWSAALAEGQPPVHAEDLVRLLAAVEGALVAEGAGGLAVPLNRTQNFADVAKLAGLTCVVVVGLRLGCINHALLTAAMLEERGIALCGAVLVERWRVEEPQYRADVERALRDHLPLLGCMAFEVDERRSIEEGARLFRDLP